MACCEGWSCVLSLVISDCLVYLIHDTNDMLYIHAPNMGTRNTGNIPLDFSRLIYNRSGFLPTSHWCLILRPLAFGNTWDRFSDNIECIAVKYEYIRGLSSPQYRSA